MPAECRLSRSPIQHLALLAISVARPVAKRRQLAGARASPTLPSARVRVRWVAYLRGGRQRKERAASKRREQKHY